MFTTGLDARDFAAARTAGLRPLGQVMGAFVLRSRMTFTGLETARARAVWRMKRDARELGADAVVAVQVARVIRRRPDDWADVKAVATGMAVAWPGLASRFREPVLTNLDLQECWKLGQGGYVPVGLVMSTVMTECRSSKARVAGRVTSAGRRNFEFTALSDLTREAYRRAGAQARGRVRALRAEGVIAAQFDSRMERSDYSYYMYALTMIGTAIAPVRGDSERTPGERLLDLGTRLLGGSTGQDGAGRSRLEIRPVRSVADPARPGPFGPA